MQTTQQRFDPGQYESVLPREVKKELVSRAKPKAKNKPISDGALIVTSVILVLGAFQVSKLQHPIAVPQPLPTPVATPALAREVEPPRAELLRLPNPAPRAELVEGQVWNLNMPNGANVRAVIKGLLDSASQLPESGNHVGDAYVIGDSTWVWLYDRGAHTATWIDP